MSEVVDVVVIVGSLRAGSLNRKMAHAAIAAAPAGLQFTIVEIGDLPFYNQDLETETPPAQWVAFRERIRRAGAVLFVTPEYNRSVPGVLKNAIDVGSRPPKANAWTGKPAAVITVSTGAIGGFGANHHLRQSLVAVNLPAMAQPDAYIGSAADLFDTDGKITKDSTREFVTKFMAAFAKWIAANQSPRS